MNIAVSNIADDLKIDLPNEAIDPHAASDAKLRAAMDAATRQIAPAWSLQSTVAVNPFLGQTQQNLAEVAARLEKLSGKSVFMPLDWYANKIASGDISSHDLQVALDASPYADKPATIESLKQIAAAPHAQSQKIATIAELCATASGQDWPAVIEKSVGKWAANYFDAGVAIWPLDRDAACPWASWKKWAAHDYSADILGLSKFRSAVRDLPDDIEGAIKVMLERINPTQAGLENQFYQSLLSVNGWSQYARYHHWTAELNGQKDDTVAALLAVCLSWDYVLFEKYAAEIQDGWQASLSALADPSGPGAHHIACEILQVAYENSCQRGLAAKLGNEGQATPKTLRPAIQAAFCIDVRSEVYRRALETVDPMVETFGFAGFFGLPVQHHVHGSDGAEAEGDHSAHADENRLPVLLKPGLHSKATTKDRQTTTRPWYQFKTAAVSSFGFVESAGPSYVWKLIKSSLNIGPKTVASASDKPVFDPPLSDKDACDTAEKILRAMALTDNFAKLVLLVGHGAHVTNNPHQSALHCGACGGHAGDVNARLLAGLLNQKSVRSDLRGRGIEIPEDTVFIAALHDTTTDHVSLFDGDLSADGFDEAVDRLKKVLAQASLVARTERAGKLPGADSASDVARRALSWSETRPEWGLAGCRFFIAAPRHYSAGADLAGESFLHNYDRVADAKNNHAVLELILTAPVVVASWISLQYYGSTVAPDLFGAGNKLLHNVVGGVGVYEGNGGDLRTGLPIQSVHNGDDFVHHPARLSVCVDASTDAINAVLARHPEVKALFDHKWLHLFAFNAQGQLSVRYAGDLNWIDAGPSFGMALPKAA